MPIAPLDELQRAQPAMDLGLPHGNAQDGGDAVRPHHHLRRLARRGVDVDGAGQQPPSRELHDQLRAAVRRPVRAVLIHAALEAVRGLGVQGVPARGAPDPGRLEHGALQQDARGLLADLAGLSAHHPGQGDWLLAIRDHQIFRRQLPLLAVEGRERLALPRAAHDDVAAGEFLEIEPVQRMPQLEQCEVGRVHDVADRAHAAGAQPLLDPERRGTDVHTLDHSRDVARTTLRVLDVHARGQLALPGRLRGWNAHRNTRDRRQLSRDADVGERIRAVRGDVHLQDGVRESEELVDRSPHPRIPRQDHQSGMVLREPQLALREEHSVALDAAQPGPLDLCPVGQPGARPGHGDHVARPVVLYDLKN